MRHTSIVLALSAFLSHFSIQPAAGVELEDLLSGRQVPLTIQLQAMDNSWRRIAIGGQFELGDLLQSYGQLLGNTQQGLYYTQGRTVVVGGETYVIAYRLPASDKALNFTTLLEGVFGGGTDCSALETSVLKAETSLALALLNLRTIGSINQVYPFNLDQALAESQKTYEAAKVACEQAQAEQIATEANDDLWLLGYALLLYSDENEGTLPPMETPTAAQDALFNWIGDREVFTYSQTSQPYQPNTSLSGKKLAEIPNPEQVVAFYETQPREDGSRTVVFLDGSVNQVTESDWSRVKQVSGLP
ncbi:MAG: hypothetical protein ACRC8A_15345 [Microcoleaceae cyanobacterium]